MKSHHLFSLVLSILLHVVVGWQQCSKEPDGPMGRCPDKATCCLSSLAVEGFSCIPSKAQDPTYAQGICCYDNDGSTETGCGYGYQCAIDPINGTSYCKLVDEHPDYLYNDTARYDLCSVPLKMQTPFGFPIQGGGEREGMMNLAYYSSMGDIRIVQQMHLKVTRVVIVIHGSERNVEDYFCAGLSLLPKSDNEIETTTLIIAPLFASPEDTPLVENMLIWADRHDSSHALSHSWRYGADALNAPISSYATIDAAVEYLMIAARLQYPNLKRIAVAGHSAGGQVTHRWALLSSSPIWEDPIIDLVSIVANPRSFCYLDGRRVHSDNDDETFDIPNADDIQSCPGYDQWQWGLQDGGYLQCPYRDAVMEKMNRTEISYRYTNRRVIYLSGQLDTIPTEDECETTIFQGPNRQIRAKNYVRGLQETFGYPIHPWYIIIGSPHDHTLMFQSERGKKSIFGDD